MERPLRVPFGDCSQLANEDVEQSLLGAVLFDNSLFDRISDFLRADHFHFPVHQRIFAAITRIIAQGVTCSAITLKNSFEGDADLSEVGGGRYIADLASNVVMLGNVSELGRHVFDLYQRRRLIETCDTAKAAVFDLAQSSATDVITDLEAQLYELTESSPANRPLKDFAEVAAETIRIAGAAHRQDQGAQGLSTGLRDVNGKIGGLMPPDLLILAGRPSMGKTALATRIASAVARAGVPVAFFSLEMSAEQIGARIISSEAAIPGDMIRKGTATADQFRSFLAAGQRLAAIPLFIDDKPAQTMAHLRSATRRLKRRRGALGLIVVDYIQLIRPDTKHKGDNRVQELTEITAALKALAKEFNVPVLALSQLSRAVEQREDKRPQLADLRDSGSIEQDSDIVGFVFREEYYLEREEPLRKGGESEGVYNDRYDAWALRKVAARGRAELIIAKHRNGPIGVVPLHWHGPTTTFSDVAPDTHSEGRE